MRMYVNGVAPGTLDDGAAASSAEIRSRYVGVSIGGMDGGA